MDTMRQVQQASSTINNAAQPFTRESQWKTIKTVEICESQISHLSKDISGMFFPDVQSRPLTTVSQTMHSKFNQL